MNIWSILVFLYINAQFCLSSEEGPLLTQTIYGFLDFTTTIGNTVMVFSPQSAPSLVIKEEIIAPIIKTKPEKVSTVDKSDDIINPTKLKTANIKSKTQDNSKDKEENKSATLNAPISQIVDKAQDIIKTSLPVENDIQDPEYDLLSRQPPQFIEESFRVVNLKSNSKSSRTPVVITPEKNTVSSIALSTKSTSRSHKNKKNKVRPSSTLQVLKTAAPVQSQKQNSKVTQRNTSSSTSTRKSNKKNSSHRGISSSTTQPEEDVVIVKSTTTRNKPKRKNKHKSSTTTKPRYSTSTSATTTDPTARRAFRPKLQVSNSDLDNNNNLHITKLNRTPGRWQYKTSPKPRVNIRKPTIETNGSFGLNNANTSSSNLSSNALVDSTLSESMNGNFLNQNIIYNQSDLELSGSQNGPILNNIDQEGKQKLFTETINVEISTPVDFKDTYYEIATIKKPFIFQAGVLKKTRFITVTSTIEKYLTPEPSIEPRNDDEPLTENILATTDEPEGVLAGSVSTLPPIYVDSDTDTPILETLTESFSIVNKKLKTQILPVIKENDNETSYHTLVQTIDITSLITVTKTFSPKLETKEFNGFKDFVGNLDEAGSEINLDLEFGDEGNHENNSGETHRNEFDGTHVNKTTKENQQIFSTGVLNLPTANVITNSRPVIKLETLWESYIVPITNGQSTLLRTLSKAKGVVEKTDFVVETTTLSISAPILQPSTINPFLLPLPQQFQTITSPIVQQTIVTQTQSKVLKLTFGAKTAYTTLYSTQVVPTVQTMYVTTSVPVQPTANPFQGFFPQPYNPFAYLG